MQRQKWHGATPRPAHTVTLAAKYDWHREIHRGCKTPCLIGFNQQTDASFEILKAMKNNIMRFWFVTACSDMTGYQHFGRPY